MPAAVVGSVALAAPEPEDAQQSRYEPEQGREEGEGNVGLELAAELAERGDVAPMEDGTAAVTEELFCQALSAHRTGSTSSTMYTG